MFVHARWLAALAFGATTAIMHGGFARDALACGGCVHSPPTPGFAPSTVTQHRMALSLSSRQTTLWDQFSYAGDPGDFAWILPIRHDPAVRVELADDRFLAMFDESTQPLLLAPPPPPSPCPTYCAWDPCAPVGIDGAVALDAASNADASVTVYRTEVVGPYQVSVIGGADAMALRAWLVANSYVVPATIQPILDAYVAQRMDFVAVRLRSSAGASRMSPIRVTVSGYAPTLPLRMVSAGISDKVGLQLLVFADSRIEAMNFPNAVMSDNEFAFDYGAQTWPPATRTDLSAMIRSKHALAGGRTWLTESSEPWGADRVRRTADEATRRWRSSSCPAEAGVSGDLNCGGPLATTDAEVALAGLGASVRITRMTADLAYTALTADLQLAASTSDAERPRTYAYGRLSNIPTPPVCEPLNCPVVCDRDARAVDVTTVPAVDARAMDASAMDAATQDSSAPPPSFVAGGGVRCSVHQRASTSGDRSAALFSLAAVFAALVVRAQRSKRRS